MTIEQGPLLVGSGPFWNVPGLVVYSVDGPGGQGLIHLDVHIVGKPMYGAAGHEKIGAGRVVAFEIGV